jgi:hypothetical protein
VYMNRVCIIFAGGRTSELVDTDVAIHGYKYLLVLEAIMMYSQQCETDTLLQQWGSQAATSGPLPTSSLELTHMAVRVCPRGLT